MDRRFAFALVMPVVLILIILAIIHWPKHITVPKEDFIFTLTKDPFCVKGNYTVEHNKLMWRTNKKVNSACQEITRPKLYRYVVNTHATEPINFKAIKFWVIDPSETSEDGFKIMNAHSEDILGGITFFSFHMHNAYYLMGHGTTEVLQLPQDTNQYQQFKFLGWIQS